jgi:hypothetical protein
VRLVEREAHADIVRVGVCHDGTFESRQAARCGPGAHGRAPMPARRIDVLDPLPCPVCVTLPSACCRSSCASFGPWAAFLRHASPPAHSAAVAGAPGTTRDVRHFSRRGSSGQCRRDAAGPAAGIDTDIPLTVGHG